MMQRNTKKGEVAATMLPTLAQTAMRFELGVLPKAKLLKQLPQRGNCSPPEKARFSVLMPKMRPYNGLKMQ
jgi:hypothetical protein